MSASSQSTCIVVHPPEQATYQGKQGMTYFAGISTETAGSQHLCLNLLTFQPGERGRAHMHEHHETAIYGLSGGSELWYGDQLQNYVVVNAGDFVYIPAGMPHVPGNKSPNEVCTVLLARTDPNEQESVVLLPELDRLTLQRKPI
jgi:uncharacterized RmlC-like cupin family protein